MNRLALVAAAALIAAMPLEATGRTTYSSSSLFDKLFFLHDPMAHHHRVARRSMGHRPERRRNWHSVSARPAAMPRELPTKIPTEIPIEALPPAPVAPVTPPAAPAPEHNLGDDVITAAQLDNPNCLTPRALTSRLAKVVNDNSGRMLVQDAADTKLFLDIITADTPTSSQGADLSVTAAFIDRDTAVVFLSKGGCVGRPPLRIGTDLFVKAQQAVQKSHF